MSLGAKERKDRIAGTPEMDVQSTLAGPLGYASLKLYGDDNNIILRYIGSHC